MANPKNRNLHISIENLGPLRSGTIEFKPLTILIGPNNSGKSYAALLVYALWQALSGNLHRPLGLVSYPDLLAGVYEFGHHRVPLHGVPADQQQRLIQALDQAKQDSEQNLVESLKHYFALQSTSELIGHDLAHQTMNIRIDGLDQHYPFLDITIEPDDISMSWASLDTSDISVPLLHDPVRWPSPDDPNLSGAITRYVWLEMLAAHGFPERDAYHLPAARSGLLAGLDLLTLVTTESVWRGGTAEQLPFPPFAGAAADFLQIMLACLLSRLPQEAQREDLNPAIDALESGVFDGQVSVMRSNGLKRPAMVYETNGRQLPIHRTSSMVAELAPLDLWMKHLLQPGDLLLIDEPEAHLHPENQRRIARVLVRLMRAGVRVICPTHSSLILHQVSNFILASKATPLRRQELGLTDDDVVDISDVGVYIFDTQRDGAIVSSVEIDAEFGISEDEFIRVAEAIGEETYLLSQA